MPIWVEKPIAPASTLAVSCLSSLAAARIKQKRQAERELSTSILEKLGDMMEDNGIEKFDDGFYHGLIHPYDANDVVNLVGGKVQVDACFEAAGFVLYVTPGVGQMFLMGKSSRLVDVIPVWLLEKKDIPKGHA